MHTYLITGWILCTIFLVTWATETTTKSKYYMPGGARISSQRVGPIGGDCWQGELCKQRCLISANKAGFVGQINKVPVCCPFCERSGLSMSSEECNCRHNGPDPKYEPTEAERREVEEFKRRLNNSPMLFASCKVMLMALLTVLSLSL